MLDVRFKRRHEIYSDHYLVLAKNQIKLVNNEHTKHRSKNNISKEVIKAYKLHDAETAKKYTEIIKNLK